MKRIQFNKSILLSIILTNTVPVDASHIEANIEATRFNHSPNHSTVSIRDEFCPAKTTVISIPHCTSSEAYFLGRPLLNTLEVEHTISEFEKFVAGNIATARDGE